MVGNDTIDEWVRLTLTGKPSPAPYDVPEFVYQGIMERLPPDLRYPKHDFPNDVTLAERRIWREIAVREAQFLACECT